MTSSDKCPCLCHSPGNMMCGKCQEEHWNGTGVIQGGDSRANAVRKLRAGASTEPPDATPVIKGETDHLLTCTTHENCEVMTLVAGDSVSGSYPKRLRDDTESGHSTNIGDIDPYKYIQGLSEEELTKLLTLAAERSGGKDGQ